MIKLRLPTAFDLLLFWHGLFAGAYTIAYLTAERAPGLHEFAGYVTLGLLAVRILAARSAGGQAPWAWPLPPASMWKNFARKLITANFSALLGRTPFAPLSGLIILAVMVLVSLSGLIADWWGWDNLHEGVSEGSLALVSIHIAIVSFAPLLRRLTASHREQQAAKQVSVTVRNV